MKVGVSSELTHINDCDTLDNKVELIIFENLVVFSIGVFGNATECDGMLQQAVVVVNCASLFS